MQRVFTSLGLFLLLLVPLHLWAQLVVIIEDIPAYTPPEDTIYLTGAFNDWKPKDENFRFQQLNSGQYQYAFLTPVPDFEYKITRGGWPTVEGGKYGEPIGNRKYLHNGKVSDTIRLNVLGWEDLKDSIAFFDTLQIKVAKLPENTPPDASLFVVGSFNGWSPRDEDYKMKRLPDGHLVATIPLRDEVTEFKITRGSWSSIESRKNGLALPNRRFMRPGAEARPNSITINIANWEDFASHQFGWYSIISLLTALQAFILLFAFRSFKARKPLANRLLITMIIAIALALLARVGGFNRDIFQAFPKLILVPSMAFFLLAPLYWLYLQALQGQLNKLSPKDYWHFLPLLLAILAHLPLLVRNDYAFTTQVVSQQLRPFFLVIALSGWLYNFVYWWRTNNLLNRWDQVPQTAPQPYTSRAFLRAFFTVLTITLFSWLVVFLLGTLDWALGKDWSPFTDGWTDLTWVFLALSVYVLGYYVIRQPQIFRTAPPVGNRTPATPLTAKVVATNDNGASPLNTSAEISALNELMLREMPHLNPGLTLADLAEMAGTPPHHLSRLINDGFQKNFFDFINSYRIDAFKEQLNEGAHASRTILSLALEVGFNSKTAFNRAFKKHTDQTPREYLRKLKANNKKADK